MCRARNRLCAPLVSLVWINFVQEEPCPLHGLESLLERCVRARVRVRACVWECVCRGKRKVSMCTDLYFYHVSLDMGAVVGRRPYLAPCVRVCACVRVCVCVCRGKWKVSMCMDLYVYDVSLDMGAVKPRRN